MTTMAPSAPKTAGVQRNLVFLVRSDVKKELERGKKCFDQGDFSGARESYERALDLDPGCAIAYFYLGFSYHEAGDLELAKDYYLQAIDLDRKQSLFLEHLARLHFELEEYSVCLVRFQEAQTVGSLQPISYGLMGRAYLEMERFPEAIYCLERMLEMEEESRLSSVARYYLILAHLGNGSIFPARKETTILLQQECDRVIYSSLAERFMEFSCFSLAKSLIQKLKDDPADWSERQSEIDEYIQRGESQLSALFCSDEENLLHRIHQISRFGTDRICKALFSLSESPSILVREAILSFSRKYGYPVSADFLSKCLQSEALVRDAAILLLAETLDPNYLNLLVGYLNHSSKEVRHAIARFMEQRGSLHHLPLLEAQMELEEMAALRRQLQRAINQIKRRHTEQTDKMTHSQPLPKKPPAAIRSSGSGLPFLMVSLGLVCGYFLYLLAMWLT